MKKFYRENGVASVIGTLFALLLAVTIISAFMTQYVPVIMKTNEAQHDIEVLSDFSQIKTFTDLLVATNEENYSFTVPITMGSSGIPIFAPSTPSSLQIVSNPYPLVIVNLTVNNQHIYQNSSGYFYATLYNSYYPEERVLFLNGAVLRENVNENRTTVYVGPGFSIKNSTNGLIVNLIIYNILGSSSSYTGTDTINVEISLLGIQKLSYNNVEYANISVNKTVYPGDPLINWYQNQSELFGYAPILNETQNLISFKNVYQVNFEIVYMNVQFSSF